MTNLKGFTSPDLYQDEDQQLLKATEKEEISWEDRYWKPKPGMENVIRILPGIGGANFHLRFGKHFIKHEDRVETFVCNRITYNDRCLACEEYDKFIKAGQKEAASKFAPVVKGAFNIIDYSEDPPRVKIWEAPPTAVWLYIVKIVRSQSRFSNVVGTKDNPLEGRDVIVYFDPDASPQNMYKVQFDAVSVLDPKYAEKWLAEAVPLVRETLYPKTPDDVARIKMFGTPEEREALRVKLAEGAGKTARTPATPSVEVYAGPKLSTTAPLTPQSAVIYYKDDEEEEAETVEVESQQPSLFPEPEITMPVESEVELLRKKLAEAEEKLKHKPATSASPAPSVSKPTDTPQPAIKTPAPKDKEIDVSAIKAKVDAIRKKHKLS